MEWAPEAKAALQHVPFFVRKRVRARAEKEEFSRRFYGTAV